MATNSQQADIVGVSVNRAILPTEAMAHLIEISVDEDLETPSLFTLRLATQDDLALPFRWIDDETLFAIGNEVEIRFADKDGAMTTVMNGEITALEPDFAADARPALTVRGYDFRCRLQRGRKTRSFVKQKDSEIAVQIAGEAGLSGIAADSGVVFDYLLQNNQSDFEFLQERAAQIGWELGIAKRTLLFQPVGNAEGEAFALNFRDDLVAFSPRLSTAGQNGKIVVRGWDPRNKTVIESTADRPDTLMGGRRSGAELGDAVFDGTASVEIAHPAASQDEADRIARGLFNRMALNLIEGEGACTGRPDLRAGKVIGLRGLGKRFSGPYYVTRTTHRYDADRGYETRFEAKRTAL